MGDYVLQKPSKKRLKAAFSEFSGNKECLDLAGFKNLCYKFLLAPTTQAVDQLFKELDKDSNSELTFDEVEALVDKQWTPITDRRNMFIEDMGKCRKKGKTGPITRNELKEILQHNSDEALTDEEIDFCFDKMDLNGDKELTIEEIAKFMFHVEEMSRANSRCESRKSVRQRKNRSRSRSKSRSRSRSGSGKRRGRRASKSKSRSRSRSGSGKRRGRRASKSKSRSRSRSGSGNRRGRKKSRSSSRSKSRSSSRGSKKGGKRRGRKGNKEENCDTTEQVTEDNGNQQVTEDTIKVEETTNERPPEVQAPVDEEAEKDNAPGNQENVEDTQKEEETQQQQENMNTEMAPAVSHGQ